MARFDDDLKLRVRESIDMIELLRGQVQLTRRGNRWWGRCPFHDERTPSFSLIPPENQRYYCQGCGATGDCFDWMMQKEGAATFPEAVERLCERAGIEPPAGDTPVDRERREARDARQRLLERAAEFYVRCLWTKPEAQSAREYLLGRGFGEELLRRFRVGYAPGSGSDLSQQALRSGFSPTALADAGLARVSGGRPRDFFVSRITFPIADESGRVQGFGARTMDPNDRAKYVNSPDGAHFKKRDLLFGLSLARASASKQGWIVVAEGYTDVMAFAQAGVESAVACMGTSLTTEQLKKLARYVDEIRLSFDDDTAGMRAAMRTLEARRGVRKTVRMAALRLSNGQDPGDYATSPEEQAELRRIVASSEPLVPCLIRYRVEQAGDVAADRERALQDIIEMLQRLEDGVEKDEAVRVAVSELKLSRTVEERLWEQSRHRSSTAEPPPARPAVSAQDEHERNLLALVTKNGAVGVEELAGVWPEAFLAPEHQRVRALLAAGMTGPDDWPEELRPLWGEIAARAAGLEGGERALREAVYRLQLPVLERRAGDLLERGDEKGFLEVQSLIRRLKAATRGDA